MLLNPWSIALLLVAVLATLLILAAARTAVNVLRHWNPASDDNRQIRLENETWLAATLVQYALGFQIASLIVFAMAADAFSEVIVGAMCATGSLTADPYGMPLLLVKLGTVFLYGFWIVVHQLDISGEDYPLLRFKYALLLALVPVVLVENILLVLYIRGLTPDIITSCCAVVFGGAGADSNLMGAGARSWIVPAFYGGTALLAALAVPAWRRPLPWQWFSLLAWAAYLPLSFIAITTVFSSYIYAMPYHRCPFCILKPEYHYIGYLIYAALLLAVFLGMCAPMTSWLARPSIKETVAAFRRRALAASMVLLAVFVTAVSFHYLTYRYLTGEW